MPTSDRHSDRPLPPYRYLPGRGVHPTRDPAGHSYGLSPLAVADLSTADWRTNEDFLFAVDLFNHRFWWEAHEIFEALWHAAGRRTPAGHCLQALIQCAAAHLQAELAHARGAQNLLRRARRHAGAAGASTLGVDLAALLAATEGFVRDPGGPAARLNLAR